MKKTARQILGLLVPTTLICWTTTFSSTARADQSCSTLLQSLRNSLNGGSGVSMQHMTNYQTNTQRFGGYTEADISVNGFFFVGSANRLLSSRSLYVSTSPSSVNPPSFGSGYSQPFYVKQPDPISYKINTADNTMTFNGQYGPYPMTCLGDKFAIVNTSDSIETFVFVTLTRPR
jgi:hypothetical protein